MTQTASKDDVLELLLPEAEPAALREAETLVTFLRLLADDARGPGAEVVGLNLRAAQSEMERISHQGLLALYEDLLRYHLDAALEADSFTELGAPGRSLQEAWSEIERLRPWTDELPGVPAPGEPPLEVARRVLRAAERVDGAGSMRSALWRARCTRVAEGARKGEKAFAKLLEESRQRADGLDDQIACVKGVTECLLDQGAVNKAFAWLDRHLTLVSCDEELARILSWVHLLRGEEEAAAETVRGMPPHPGVLPASLVELRERVPAWRPLLSGRASGRPPCRAPEPLPSRAELGACVFGVFAMGPGRSLLTLRLDAAPGLRSKLEAWLRRRDGICASMGEPEHLLVTEARAIVAHRRGEGGLRGALAPRTSACLALVPVLDADEEVAGWIHLECEHHLLPSAARLRVLAEAWREEVAAARRAASPRIEQREAGSSPRSIVDSVADAPLETDEPGPLVAPCAEVLRELVAELRMKTSQRRWWGFEVHGLGEPGLRLVGEGGERLEDWRDRPGDGRAHRRALCTGGSVLFQEPDPRLSVHAAAASGMVVPIVFRGSVHGLLAVESTRRRDFRAADVERVRGAASAIAIAWRAAQFRSWHLQRYGHDVYFDARREGAGSRLLDLPVAARSRSPLVLVGPEGSGRKILARWIHFEGVAPRADCELFSCALEPADLERRRLYELLGRSSPGDAELQPARGQPRGTLVLDELDRLPECLQAALLELIPARPDERERNGTRLVATARCTLDEAVGAGRLLPELAARFARLELYVPPLCERRDEIPPLVRLLARRFAAEEGVAPPEFEDAALALLWRQPWAGNVRQLENLVYKLALFHPGQSVAAQAIRELAARFRLELIDKLPSRRPKPEDVRCALRSTLKSTGAINKTRAALYLGWDPDTLVVRMKEHGLDADS